MLAGWFARRYFFSKKSHSVINLIAGVSVVSVAVPVAAMIVLLSVFNGFEQLVRSMNSHFDADLTLTPREGQTFGIESLDTAALRRLPGVEAVSLALEQSALMEYRGRQAMVTVRGVADGYDRVVPVAECITAGDYAVRLGDLDRLVVGRGVAYELGLRSLGESDGVLYALRRTGFSSLLPVEGYTRRQAEVAGVFAARRPDRRPLPLHLAQAGAGALLLSRSGVGGRGPRGPRRTSGGGEAARGGGGGRGVRGAHARRAERFVLHDHAVREVGHLPHFAAGARHRLVLDRGDGGDARAGQAAGVRRTGRHGADTRFVRRIFFFEGGLIGVLGAGAGVVLGVGLCLVQHYFGVIEIPADSFLVKSYPVLLRGGDVAAVVAAFAVVVGAMTAVTVRRAVRADDMAAGRTVQ